MSLDNFVFDISFERPDSPFNQRITFCDVYDKFTLDAWKKAFKAGLVGRAAKPAALFTTTAACNLRKDQFVRKIGAAKAKGRAIQLLIKKGLIA